MEVIGQHHAPAVLPSGKNAQYPLGRRQEYPQNQSGSSEKMSVALAGN